MPGPRNLPNEAAEDTVFDNLGLTREDLGMDGVGDDLGSGNEDLEAGSGNENLGDGDFDFADTGDDGQDPSDDRRTTGQQPSRVTHTDPPTPKPIPTRAEVKTDKNGNLLGKDGTIIARAGREARYYQDAFKAKGSVKTLQGQVNDVNSRLRKAVEIGQGLHRDLIAARAHNEAITQFGISANEQLSAMRLFKDLRDNPKETLKKVLTRAAANGITMDELGTATGGVDSKSLIDLVRETIGKELNPLRESTAAAAKAKKDADDLAARSNEVQSQVKAFFEANPEAVPHLQVFTNAVQQFPGMTLGEIWARIQLNQAKNPPAERRTQNSRRPTGQRSLPSGRNMPVTNGHDDMAPVSDSYDTIVRAALDSVGLTR